MYYVWRTISSLTKWKGEKNTCVVARNLVVDYSLLPLTTPLLLVGAYVEGEKKKVCVSWHNVVDAN